MTNGRESSQSRGRTESVFPFQTGGSVGHAPAETLGFSPIEHPKQEGAGLKRSGHKTDSDQREEGSLNIER